MRIEAGGFRRAQGSPLSSLPPFPPSFQGRAWTGDEAARRASLVSGPFRAHPQVYLDAAGPAHVAEAVAWAAEHGLSIIPRGGGTGMPGGNLGPYVVLSVADGLSGIEVDTASETVVAGAGAVADAVDRAARSTLGRRLPFLPASAAWCRVGGLVANDSAGAGTFGHGATHGWVEAVRGVDARGNDVHLTREGTSSGPLAEAMGRLANHPTLSALAAERDPEGRLPGWPRVRKNSSGYALDRFLSNGSRGQPDALQLLVGSEGTLALITEVRFRTAPIPETRGVLLLPARGPDDLVALVLELEGAGAVACEMLGRRFLEITGLRHSGPAAPLARDAYALLLVEVEGTAPEVAAALDRCQALGQRYGGPGLRARSQAESDELWRLRKAASPIIARQARQGLLSTQFIEDCVVPVPALGRFLVELDRILEAARFDAVVFGHAGDGNIHVNPLVDVEAPDWHSRVRQALEAVADLVADLGGTLAGEHGDGRLRAPFLERIWGPRLAGAFREVKETLDPAGTLNPGVIVPLPGQDPLEGLSPRPRSHP
ncbi:MAG: FAD-binding oxidoreductase [Gemmatimonadales bacterium]|nr:MAG: FAD-binding oxidoreductase [Gemmatimonadales bacterium]